MIKYLFLSALLVIAPLVAKENNNGALDANEMLLKQVSKGFSRVAKKAIPAVVYIESATTKEAAPEKRVKKTPQENPFDYFQDEFFRRFFGFPSEEAPAKKQETVRGSGFLVSKDGYIMTNNHVVENAVKITVTLNSGKKVTAKTIGTDPQTDLAVIKIEGEDHPFLAFGDSDALEVGDWSIAVGNPFGLEATVTVGVVSAKGRNQLHITDFEDFIQTDAAINPGNSGGPLLNIEGDVIGINTAIASASGGYMGIGFAIPSNMASHIMKQLIKEGSVTRGFLGVTLQPIDNELATFYKLDKTQGALITDVMKDSPAASAGLQQEDIIVSYNNTTVENLSSFRNAVSLMAPGTKLSLKVLRDGKIKEVQATISTLPTAPAAPAVQQLGLQVQNLTPELASQFNYNQEKGIIITQVKPGSPAAEASLHPGSLILAVNRKKVTTTDEFHIALKEALHDKSLLLMVQQGEAIRFLAIHID